MMRGEEEDGTNSVVNFGLRYLFFVFIKVLIE